MWLESLEIGRVFRGVDPFEWGGGAEVEDGRHARTQSGQCSAKQSRALTIAIDADLI